jgi:hypothetical protein
VSILAEEVLHNISCTFKEYIRLHIRFSVKCYFAEQSKRELLQLTIEATIFMIITRS